jgi:hypothetical protein
MKKEKVLLKITYFLCFDFFLSLIKNNPEIDSEISIEQWVKYLLLA